MNIRQVTVEIHEKRAHPTQMGHYDSSVACTAELRDGEDAEVAAAALRILARRQVAYECDRWVEGIKIQEEQDKARSALQWIVERLETRSPEENDLEDFAKHLVLLPPAECTLWRDKLAESQATYATRIKRVIDKLIENASRRMLSPREINDFDELVRQMPEDERLGYVTRMSDAMNSRKQEDSDGTLQPR